MMRPIRQHLSWKIFLSYLIVIGVSVIVLGTAANFAAPSAFERYIAAMGSMMGSSMSISDLFNNFRDAVSEALTLAALAALTAALIVSVFVSRRIVAPDELGGLAISFNQMTARLEQTETMRRQLIGDVAHELRRQSLSVWLRGSVIQRADRIVNVASS